MMNNVILREKEAEMKLAKDELQLVQLQVDQANSLLEKANNDQAVLKNENH